MKAEPVTSELSAILVGRRVTDRQLAGNSLSIWFDTVKGRRFSE